MYSNFRPVLIRTGQMRERTYAYEWHKRCLVPIAKSTRDYVFGRTPRSPGNDTGQSRDNGVYQGVVYQSPRALGRSISSVPTTLLVAFSPWQTALGRLFPLTVIAEERRSEVEYPPVRAVDGARGAGPGGARAAPRRGLPSPTPPRLCRRSLVGEACAVDEVGSSIQGGGR